MIKENKINHHQQQKKSLQAFKAKNKALRYTQVKSVPTFLLGLFVFVGLNLVGILQAHSFY